LTRRFCIALSAIVEENYRAQGVGDESLHRKSALPPAFSVHSTLQKSDPSSAPSPLSPFLLPQRAEGESSRSPEDGISQREGKGIRAGKEIKEWIPFISLHKKSVSIA
jgi:hypothetical protein